MCVCVFVKQIVLQFYNHLYLQRTQWKGSIQYTGSVYWPNFATDMLNASGLKYMPVILCKLHSAGRQRKRLLGVCKHSICQLMFIESGFPLIFGERAVFYIWYKHISVNRFSWGRERQNRKRHFIFFGIYGTEGVMERYKKCISIK